MEIRLRSIPKKDRYTFSGTENPGRRLRLESQQLEKQRGKYEKKKKEFQGMVESESQRFQRIKEKTDESLERISKLATKESVLNKLIRNAQKLLDEENKKQLKFIEASGREQKKLELQLVETKKEIETLQAEVPRLQSVKRDLEDNIAKLNKAGIEYKTLLPKLTVAQKKYAETLAETSKQLSEADKKNKDLDSYHEYLKEMSGKLTTSLSNIREMTEELNEMLKENKIPVELELPPKQLIPF